MIKAVFPIIAGVLLSASACGGKKDPGPDAGACADAGTKGFGEACASACECSSLVCFAFGDGTSSCTLNCSSNTECPSGSQGQKCNGQGACRP